MSGNSDKRIQKLLPTEEMGQDSITEGKFAEADERLKECLPIINCECGAEILVVPDLQAMNNAIKRHVAKHRKLEKEAKNNFSKSGKISQLLSQLTLTKISEQNNG